jgi:ribosomal protein S18 acetylase RimI-like enzyme
MSDVRALEQKDLPDLLELLKLQDEDAAFRTMGPESRTEDELADELGDATPYSELYPFVLEQNDKVAGYVGLCNYQGEAFLEGPILAPEVSVEAARPLLERAVATARDREYGFVEAFTDEQNERSQGALEAAGFEAFRTTYIYELTREHARPSMKRSTPFTLVVTGEIDVSTYRDLYRETSDNWATRLAWSDEELVERFSEPGVALVLAYEGERLVGHLELEIIEEESYAEVAYFGVLPEVRGRGLGRALLARGIEEAFKHDDVQIILARAHDDERAASHTLEQMGFRWSHGVVAYTLELE